MAAAIAGIAGERLAAAGYPDAKLVLPLVFAVIASTVLLHGLSLAPLARKLGLASGGRGGLLIVGASAWSVALGEALRNAGMPVIVVDRSALALKAARLVGLQTLRMEVLSTIGEEIIDLREFEHLIAATPDDAYNALVCTRFAVELGRERVYQVAPNEDSERHATSREWRGKIAVAEEMTHQRLAELMAGGAAFVTEPAPDGGPLPASSGASWPTAVLAQNGSFTMYSPETPVVVAPSDIVVRLYQPALGTEHVAPRTRWNGIARRYRERKLAVPS